MNERHGCAHTSRPDARCAARLHRSPHGTSMRGWLTRGFLLLVVAGAGLHASSGFAQKLLDLPSLPLQGIGRVEAIAVQGDGKIIIGGAFNYVDVAGDVRVNIARFNSNGTLDTTFNFKATSAVDALAIIGNTLYLGGDFTGLSQVGGASALRNRLAAIDLPSLTITSWDPNADGEVFAMAASGTTLYVGGAFTFIGGGTQRIGAAAFNTAAVGTPLTTWDPEPRDANAPGPVFQGVVYALAPFGGAVYVGGTFTQIGGNNTSVLRDNIAAVDTSTGLAMSWDPVASNGGGTAIVRSIVPTASVVYLAGQFSGLNGVSSPFAQRLGIGAVSTSTGVATAWNPGMASGFGTVRAMVMDGTTLFAGGEFTAIGGATRNHAAGIDTSTPAITALTRVSTTATAQVASTAGLANGNSVTIAGATPVAYNGIQGPITVVDATHFTFPIAGSPTTPATGTITYAKNNNATAFNANLDGDVHAMALTIPSTSVLLGGSFLKANSVTNPAFGGFDKTSGAITIAGYVYDTAAVWSLVRQPDGKTIVAGDYFTVIGGVFYRGLLRLNANDTLDASWNPLADGQVVTAALGPIVPPATAPTTVLVGGTFTKIGSTTIPRLAAVNLATGLATSFNANVNSAVQKVIVDGSTAYIGGRFTSVGGVSRFFVAAVDGTSGALQSWYPAGGADGFIEALAVDASNVYLGGSFFTIGGQARHNVAKVAKVGSSVDAWHPDPDEIVFGITVSGSTVYISGNFSTLGGIARNFTGAVNATTGAVLAFNPNPDFIVLKVTVPSTPPNTVYLSGAFINVAGTQTGTAAAVDATSGAVKPWFPLTNDAVYDLLPDATHVMVGGVFVSSGLVPRLSLAAFANSGVRQRDFNGDGKGDIIWANSSTGEKLMWLMNGGTIAGGGTLLTDLNWSITHYGDFNGDGKTDLLWRNTSTGETVIWLMNGAAFAGGASLLTSTAWSVIKVGDFNGDGKMDLLWRNSVTGEVVIWLMNGTTIIGSGTLLTDLNWMPTHIADFNGDGKDDILWRNTATGQTVIWIMNGASFVSGGAIMSDPNWTVTHVADFNADGKADIVWRNTSTGFTALWLMDGTTLLSGTGLLSDPNWVVMPFLREG